MSEVLTGFQRKLHHTRYAKKSLDKVSYLKKGQPVVVLTKDGKYPTRELGHIEYYKENDGQYTIGTKLSTWDSLNTFADTIFEQELSNVDILLETEFEQTADRIATSISSVEKKHIREDVYSQIKQSVEDFLLIPAGRIMTGAGDDSEVTLFNCYVVDVEPAPYNIEAGRDSRQAIFYHQARISEIMARGGGVGTNLSVFRPKYSDLSKTKGRSTGAVFIGNMLSGVTNFAEQGNRRGAQMLTIHDWHPDVFYSIDSTEDFIGAKQKPGFMEGNNSSVLISDEFMHAVENDLDWKLVFPDTSYEKYDLEWDGDINTWKEKGYPVKVHKTVKAVDMWNKLNESNRISAEPGIIFIDRVNKMHNGRYLGTVKATNPCGEQPILGNSTCNLSAVNLGRMIRIVGEDEEGYLYEIDWELLKETIHTGVRFLDNVIDVTYYFDKEMEEWQKGERRVGLGVLGVHDMLIALKQGYGSPEGNETLEEVFRFIRDTAYRVSIELAKEKGSFPLYDEKGYLSSGFVQTLPKDIIEDIKKYGIRNLTLLTIAPTGTTGTMTPSLLDPEGSVSTGIEPHFAMKFDRTSRVGNTVQYAGVAKAYMDRNPGKKLPDYFVGAMDLSPERHVTVQAIAQKYIDTSISKTINAPKGYTTDQVKSAYELGFKLGLKGMTVYVDESRDEQILSLSKDEVASAEHDNVVVELKTKVKGKYDDWECPNCGHEEYVMQDGCPLCKSCGSQACSL